MEKVPAIAYLRSDVSGACRHWDECRMFRLSERLGYTLCDVLVLCAAAHSRIDRLLRLIAIERAEAVFVPHLGHLDGDHMRVVLQADVIVDAHEVYARWPSIVSWNDMTCRPSEDYDDHPHSFRRPGVQDVRPSWSEPPSSPNENPGKILPHLRALQSPNSKREDPGDDGISAWFLDR